ncbi:MAG: dihydrodipicolinate synthase family protein, partial [Spirochaetota bacterium]|nr:dihydrodipicolinate synthase family protein [Spirochaetota bacterium]
MNRDEYIRRFLPEGIPALWCPMITHFKAAATPDRDRIHRHLDTLKDDVRGILIPGSTGEGWDMNDADILRLLDIVLDKTAETGQYMLIGVLKTETQAMIDSISNNVDYLTARSGGGSWSEAFVKNRVAGFTICPPSGADISQEEIREGLEAV